MKSLDKIIYIAGVARSGTSWLGQILASHPAVCFRFQPLFSYEFKGRIDEDSSAEELQKFLKDLSGSDTSFLRQQDKVYSGDYPLISETGNEVVLAFKENRYQSVIGPMLRRVPNLRVLCVIRHPCAVLNSWRKNPSEFPLGADFNKEWRHGMCKNLGPQDYFGFFRWKEVCHLYLDLIDQLPDRVCLVHYEKLAENPINQVTSILEFCGLEMEPQVQRFLDKSVSSQNENYYSVFKKAQLVASRWKDEMPPGIVDEIYAELQGTRLERFLYEPFFESD